VRPLALLIEVTPPSTPTRRPANSFPEKQEAFGRCSARQIQNAICAQIVPADSDCGDLNDCVDFKISNLHDSFARLRLLPPPGAK
jgi:hypothetical protein